MLFGWYQELRQQMRSGDLLAYLSQNRQFLMLICSKSAQESHFSLVWATDGRADGRTDGLTLFYRCENASKKLMTHQAGPERSRSKGGGRGAGRGRYEDPFLFLLFPRTSSWYGEGAGGGWAMYGAMRHPNHFRFHHEDEEAWSDADPFAPDERNVIPLQQNLPGK